MQGPVDVAHGTRGQCSSLGRLLRSEGAHHVSDVVGTVGEIVEDPQALANGFLVVAKDGSPGDGKHYKANVDVLLAIDAVELSVEMRPEVVVLVTGDADFAHLALQLRRRGIRVEVAATPQTLGTGLKGAANEVIDLVPLFESFELMRTGE